MNTFRRKWTSQEDLMENIWGTADLRFLSLTEGVSTDHKFYGGITKFSVFSFLPIGVDA